MGTGMGVSEWSCPAPPPSPSPSTPTHIFIPTPSPAPQVNERYDYTNCPSVHVMRAVFQQLMALSFMVYIGTLYFDLSPECTVPTLPTRAPPQEMAFKA